MVKNEIKVFARLKPESKRKNIVNYQIHRRPKKNTEEDYLVLNGLEKLGNDYINNRPESWNFAFYKIFDCDVKQDEIFQNVAQPVVQSVLNGYNATIFAYGQTGSGKTFSITGDPELYEDRGVLPRTIQYLFETIQKNPDNLYSVEIAYLEIYNENGYDLLDPKHDIVTKLEDLPRVTIQEDESGVLHLKNLSFRVVKNEKDALALLFLGDTNRAVSETPMNPQSSRSHCIFTIAVTIKRSGTEHLSKAKMHLVDLAGSERVYKCCISGSILTEAKHINLSLHYLEQVIVCLGQQNVSHIPYRNSLLTAILRDSLGGNCLTTMLATLSINTSNLEETISTCRFSQRVALIKNDVNIVFERNPEDENKFLKMEIEKLRLQIAQLTKRSTNQELTSEERENLNFQVHNFLQSDSSINWENDDRKINYCLQILRRKFKDQYGELNFINESEKDLNYYRNLVIQRDKEISALIEMLKKIGNQYSLNSTNVPGSFKFWKGESGISSELSLIDKRIRLKNLISEAKSIAELIKNGKASIDEKIFYSLFCQLSILSQHFEGKIVRSCGSCLVAGDLRIRMNKPELSLIEIKTLHDTLKIEQSKLAKNLNLLRTLKSEATDLKTVLSLPSSTETGSKHSIKISDYSDMNLSPRTEIKTNLKNFEIFDKKSETLRQTLTLPVSTIKCEQEIIKNDLNTKNILKKKNREKMDESKDLKIFQLGKVRNEDAVQIAIDNKNPKMERFNETKMPCDFSESPGSNFATYVKNDRQIINDGNDYQRSLIGENFRETESSFVRESGRSSFRTPTFISDSLRSNDNSNQRSESSFIMKNLYHTASDIVTNFKDDSSTSDTCISKSAASKFIIDSSELDQLFNNDEANQKSLKDDAISSRCKDNYVESDELYEASIDVDKRAKEDLINSDPRMQQLQFNRNENLEPNIIEQDKVIDEDDSFIKSLPLTGDPEIDEEIIAFYRAKRSGGTY